MIKVAFFDAKAYDKPSFEHYGSEHDMQFRFLETKLNEDTVELARGCNAVCVFVNDTVNAPVIDKLYAMGVKLIALRSAGYNNVDVQAAFGKIHVVHVPAYSPYAVAEHAIALLLTSVRRIHKAYNRTREFNFSLNGLTGFDFHGKTVGVIGTGKIGRIFIDICRGFGMKVIAYDRFPAPDSSIEYVTLDELFARSDVISLHCPLTDDTRHMINAAAIEKMKKGVVIVNTSRGGLIDAEALLEGIKARKIGAACLDVYEAMGDIAHSWQVTSVEQGTIMEPYAGVASPRITLIVPDLFAAIDGFVLIDNEGANKAQIQWTYGFDTGLSDDRNSSFAYDLTFVLSALPFEGTDGMGFRSFSVDARSDSAADYFGSYGALFFIGILLSAVFLVAAVLIIYYKQISEGYEDAKRFDIMQKVGMTKQEIRASISSQLLTVFALPLAFAALHLAFAFPMIRRLLTLFSLYNVGLFARTTMINFAVFAAFYAVIYRLTSGVYYRIVSGKENVLGNTI